MHNKVKSQAENSDTEGLQAYYRTVFFDNPWRDEKFPSFVYRDDRGRAVGFNGVIGRKMLFGGKPIRVAVSHRLMVDPSAGCPFAGPQLVRRFMGGPQDLCFTDGANDLGRKFWEGLGGWTSLLYSMNWIKPLRPMTYAVHWVAQRKLSGFFGKMSRCAAQLVDSLGAAKWASPCPPVPSENLRSLEASDELLLSTVSQLSKPYALCPDYESASWKWLMQFLRSNKHRGTFKAYVVYTGGEEPVGAYAYYLGAYRITEVMLLAAREDSRHKVLGHLLQEAKKAKTVCLWGRLEPKFLPSLWDNKCLLKRGSWALVHTKNRELADVIHRGDAFLTAMDGELWLRSPNDRL